MENYQKSAMIKICSAGFTVIADSKDYYDLRVVIFTKNGMLSYSWKQLRQSRDRFCLDSFIHFLVREQKLAKQLTN